MRRHWAVAFVIAAFASTGYSQQPPPGFKDLVPGQPKGDGDIAAALECRGDTCSYIPGVAVGVVRHEMTIGGSEILAIVATLKEGVIQAVLVQFHLEAFNTIRDGLKAKYPSLTCHNGSIQNRLGASFEQEKCIAKIDRSTMVVDRYGDTTEHGQLAIVLDSAVEEKQQEKRKRSLISNALNVLETATGR